MKKILNTLYVTSPDAYLALDGENVVVYSEDKLKGRLPLHTLDSIVTFGYTGASPALMGKCAATNIQLVFLNANGRFLARVVGKVHGNVLLRDRQFSFIHSDGVLDLARNIISAKIKNSAEVLRRAVSDHPDRCGMDRVAENEKTLRRNGVSAYGADSSDSLRGIEGESASLYFSVFDNLILGNKDGFAFCGRTRRPPLDRVNAMLSFGYQLLTSMLVGALESVGLDPYAGVFHTMRPGRCSLALDMCEELRAPLVDRFVLSVINRREMNADDFTLKEDGAVLLNDEGRKKFLTLWQDKKRDTLTHDFIGEKTEWGMIPYVQAMLLAKFLRGDLDDYPPFVWR